MFFNHRIVNVTTISVLPASRDNATLNAILLLDNIITPLITFKALIIKGLT